MDLLAMDGPFFEISLHAALAAHERPPLTPTHQPLHLAY
jgi:hypothetical protein